MADNGGFLQLYLDALQLWTVRVVTGELHQPAKLVSCEFGQKHRKTREIVRSALCIARKDYAPLLIQRCAADFRASGHMVAAGWIDASHPEVADKLVRVAEDLGVPCETVETVHASAKAAVATLEHRVEMMRRSGGLAAVNAAFKRYRLEQQAMGLGAMAYRAWVFKFTARLVTTFAENVGRVRGGEFGDHRFCQAQIEKVTWPEKSDTRERGLQLSEV